MKYDINFLKLFSIILSIVCSRRLLYITSHHLLCQLTSSLLLTIIWPTLW